MKIETTSPERTSENRKKVLPARKKLSSAEIREKLELRSQKRPKIDSSKVPPKKDPSEALVTAEKLKKVLSDGSFSFSSDEKKVLAKILKA